MKKIFNAILGREKYEKASDACCPFCRQCNGWENACRVEVARAGYDIVQITAKKYITVYPDDGVMFQTRMSLGLFLNA